MLTARVACCGAAHGPRSGTRVVCRARSLERVEVCRCPGGSGDRTRDHCWLNVWSRRSRYWSKSGPADGRRHEVVLPRRDAVDVRQRHQRQQLSRGGADAVGRDDVARERQPGRRIDDRPAQEAEIAGALRRGRDHRLPRQARSSAEALERPEEEGAVVAVYRPGIATGRRRSRRTGSAT